MNAPLNPPTLGVDPGNPGAAVLLNSDGSLIWAACWKKLKRKSGAVYRVRVYFAEDAEDPGFIELCVSPRPGKLGQYLKDLTWRMVPAPLLACEDAFLHKKTKNVSTVIDLARFSGAVMAPLENLTGSEARFVKPITWRHRVLRLGAYTPREQAKRASLTYIPPRVPGLARALEVLGKHDHITDAAGIALWRQMAEVTA